MTTPPDGPAARDAAPHDPAPHDPDPHDPDPRDPDPRAADPEDAAAAGDTAAVDPEEVTGTPPATDAVADAPEVVEGRGAEVEVTAPDVDEPETVEPDVAEAEVAEAEPVAADVEAAEVVETEIDDPEAVGGPEADEEPEEESSEVEDAAAPAITDGVSAEDAVPAPEVVQGAPEAATHAAAADATDADAESVDAVEDAAAAEVTADGVPGPAEDPAAPEPADDLPAASEEIASAVVVPVEDPPDETTPDEATPVEAIPVEAIPDEAVVAAVPATPRAPLTGRARLRSALHPRATRAQVFTGVLCMALGVGLAVQVRQNNQTDLTSLRQTELIALLDDTSQRADRLQAEAGELTRTRQDLVSSSDQLAAAREVADARLQVLGILAGTLPASGPGMTMTISGTTGSADVLLAAVQELRDAGAEAIQIGDVRIVASSSFLDGATAGEVLVDGRSVSSPYRFTAIGDQDSLSTAMSFPGGVIATVKAKEGTVQVQAESSVEVTALHSVSDPAYARVPEPSSDAGS